MTYHGFIPANPTYFEEEPKELDLTIAIKDLSKVNI